MDISTIISILGSLGIGAIIGAYVQNFLDKKKEIELKLNSINEERYRNLLYHMNIILNPKNTKFMNHKNPETGKQFNQEDHIEFVKAEYLQSILYAPDKVVISLKKFINAPNEQNFIEVAKEMRISLWNKKSKLSKSSLKL